MEALLQQRIDMMEAAFVDHEDGNLFLQLAETYRAAGDGDRALRVLRRGLETHPAFTPAFDMLGHVLHEAGRDAEAAVCFEQLLELDPSNIEARRILDGIATALRRPHVRPGIAGNGDASAEADGVPAAVAGDTIPAAPEADAPDANARDADAPDADAPDANAPDADAPDASGAATSPAAADALPWEEGADTPASPGTSGPPETASAEPSGTSLDAPGHASGQRDLEAGLSAVHGESTAVALADLLVGLLEYRDPFFRGGTSLTRLLTAAISRELGLDEQTTNDIALAAVLRDLGQIPLKGLIDKPGSELGVDSRRKMERHVDTALELLEGVRLDDTTRDAIRHHHERWDGTGYPAALAGEAIPLGARIVTVADSFAAMIAARPHRLPKRVPAALEDIRSGSGSQYDPAVVEALVRVLSSTSWRGLRFSLRHHILVVDPDETRAMVHATRLCSNGYLAEVAFTAETARERLKKTRIVGLVISAEVDSADIVSLLREVRDTERLGMIPVVMTDTGVSERVALLEAGADVCLARGSSFEELKATLEAFLRREGKPLPASGAKAESWAGLQGDIEDFPLGWLLQVLNYDSRSAAVFLTGGGDEGAIYLDRGSPRHAETKDLVGEDAFRDMLKWPTGSFSVDPDATTTEQTIRTSLMNLLLAQAVEQDHAAFFGSVQV
jgi:HD-GYP domain-containing protein (c-di-GMP phosphodiesterase class II)